MRQGVQRASVAMALEKMFLRAASPGAHKIVIQCAACACAEHRNHAGRPFFRNFCAYLHSDAIDDSRDDSLDGLLFDEVTA